MNDKPTRRELLRPLHLLAIAFGFAAFAGIVTAVTTGALQGENVLALSLVVAGITFIVVLLGLAMLMLVVDPAQVQKPMDRPVLMKDEDDPDDGKPGTKR
jgi:hypothetical protein